MKKVILTTLVFSLFALLSSSCSKKGCTDEKASNYDSEAKKDDDSCEYNSTTNTEGDISVLASKFYTSATTFSVGEEFITITSTNEPDHKSMYYPTNHALYENYSEPSNPDFKKNPGEIESQNYVFKIPRYPSAISNQTSTDFGAIGIAVNGVVFFNQVAAPGDDILEELNTFDQYEGHPAGTDYHYHTEPIWLTQTISNDAFIGFLLDGFPVYGPYENGKKLTNDDLDDDHGHTSATADFPDGIYHYHITDDLPWINGGNYHGKPGTVTN